MERKPMNEYFGMNNQEFIVEAALRMRGLLEIVQMEYRTDSAQKLRQWIEEATTEQDRMLKAMAILYYVDQFVGGNYEQ